ncbi:MAG TPA: hypothetical protein VFJ19_13215 [Nocardioidaceae bacterium]|nr:hypothetical protein [Nocardioidaceae bacterium]
MTRQRMIRDEPEAHGDAEVLRAHPMDEQSLRENAETNFGLYGFYGLSVFYPIGDWTKERILTEKLSEVTQVTVFRRADLATSDLRVLPTGAEPHGDIVGVPVTGRPENLPADRDALIAAVLASRHHLEQNPYHRGGEEMP